MLKTFEMLKVAPQGGPTCHTAVKYTPVLWAAPQLRTVYTSYRLPYGVSQLTLSSEEAITHTLRFVIAYV